MNINVNEWRSFHIQRTPEQSGLFKIMNCRCGSAGNLVDGDDINYIGAKKSDNGVMRTVAVDETLVSKGHGIMFICDGEGSVGYTNYMDKDFIGSTTTSIGYDDALTKENAMFLVTVLDNEKFKYSYGRKYRKHLSDTIIKLPVKHNPDGSIFKDETHKYSDDGLVPDWQFMEEYIKSLHHKPLTTQNKPHGTPALDTTSWKEYKIGDLFDVELSNGDIKADDIDDGDVALVSAGETDNGVVKHISAGGDGKAEKFDGNKITVDMFCSAYYQPEPFYAVSHGRVNILTAKKFTLNKFIGLFIATLIKNEQYRFSYGRAVYSNVAADMIIKLPVALDGSPDWQFMEDYIKALPYGDRLNG